MLRPTRQPIDPVNTACRRGSGEGEPQGLQRAEPLGDPRFARLLGREAWLGLPAAVRARFGHRVGPGDAALYRGRIEHTRMNRAGRLLSRLLQLAGGGLPLDADNPGTSVVVAITEARASQPGRPAGQFWTRQYARGERPPQVVHSAKRFDGPTGCEEWTGPLGVAHRLEATPTELVFHSDHYALRLGRWRIRLPRWMEPGALRAGHEDLGEAGFRFTLTLTHPRLGTLLDQAIHFTDMTEPTP